MGQSLFLENRGQRLVQVWLLMFCVLLCFQTGDAVKCRICNPGDVTFCKKHDVTCEGSYCMKMETFSGKTGELVSVFTHCGTERLKEKCGQEAKAKGDTLKLTCCETDLCFD